MLTPSLSGTVCGRLALMAKPGVDNTFYKYEEINLETYTLHKSENEKKPPDLDFSPQKRTKLPSAGDIWIPYTSHDPQKRGVCANDLIIQHARALAREGKRVTQAPSYLYDLRSFFYPPRGCLTSTFSGKVVLLSIGVYRVLYTAIGLE